MKRLLAMLLLVFSVLPFTGCDPLYFSIRFANRGTTDIDIVGVYMAPAGGIYGDNLLPVEPLHTGKYFVLEGLDRWSNYDVKVVFDILDPETQANFEWELKNNVPVAPPDDCVSWWASCWETYDSLYQDVSYFWGCEGEYPYELVE